MGKTSPKDKVKEMMSEQVHQSCCKQSIIMDGRTRAEREG